MEIPIFPIVVGIICLLLLCIFTLRYNKKVIYCNVYHGKDDVFFREFNQGIQQGCRDLNMDCMYISVPKNDVAFKDSVKDTLRKTSFPVIVRHSPEIVKTLKNKKHTVYVKSPSMTKVCSIPWKYEEMLFQLLEKAQETASQNDLSIIVQDEAEDPIVTSIRGKFVRTNKKRLVSSIFEGLQSAQDHAKLLIIANPNLLDRKTSTMLKRTFPDTLLFTIDYNDENVDYWVGQSPQEQGYLAAVLCSSKIVRNRWYPKVFDTKIFNPSS